MLYIKDRCVKILLLVNWKDHLLVNFFRNGAIVEIVKRPTGLKRQRKGT